MSVYTKNGDLGFSSLIKGPQIPKHDPSFEALGKLDELTGYLHLCLIKDLNEESLELILSDLKEISSYVAGFNSKLLEKTISSSINQMEKRMDLLEEKLPALSTFTGPNKTEASIYLNLTRIKSREVERKVVSLFKNELSKEQKLILRYLNRLSDYLFMLMRFY